MSKIIRIGTRDSELALWQAQTVKQRLEKLGYATRLVPIKSEGDLVLDVPLYEMGIIGVFTKSLDIAMLQGTIDIAVHSMKDVPTALPKGIVQQAVLERADVTDIVVYKEHTDFEQTEAIIATGSLRRKAQWLHRYPHHRIENLRGNVNTRLQKLHDNNWHGAIFAAAGLERISKKPQHHITLDWMISAPAQGAMVVVAMENNPYTCGAVQQLNHRPTELCTTVERQFLRTLEGGCTAPIGAYAYIQGGKLVFKGGLFSLDGTKKIVIEKEAPLEMIANFGESCAVEILKNGGKAILEEVKKSIS
ncbi:MAG: hydroxymethylbilane synthase [Capnocytophaga sp.]|nr:hydroxymethylbilane synthase [Capnocytophaga sp.]